MFRHKPKVTFSRLFCLPFHAPKPKGIQKKQKGKLCGFDTAGDLTLEAEEIFGTRNIVAFEVIRIAKCDGAFRQLRLNQIDHMALMIGEKYNRWL